jgi:hypothetical protein
MGKRKKEVTMSDLLKLIPTFQSIALLEDNYSFSKKKKKNFVKQGVKNIVGLSLIKETAKLTDI